MFAPGGPTVLELTKQALSSTHGGYEALAPKFNHTPFRTPESVLGIVEDFLGSIRVDALDVCCGTGAATAMLRRVTPGRVVGVDFSAGMLAVAEQEVAGVEFHQADARALPYDEEFDLAVSFGAFGHFRVHEQRPLLKGIYRALRPGGRFVFVTSEHPEWSHPTALLYRCFNVVMKVRNRVFPGKFIMYYLNFLLPEAEERLRAVGFDVAVHALSIHGPFPRARLVVATRPLDKS